MAKKHDLTIEELLSYLHQFEDCDFDTPFTGFSQDKIAAVEQKYQITFPTLYKNYMLRCGKHPINDVQDHMCSPDEILSNYDYLSEDIDDYAEELAEMSEEEAQKACAEYKIYQLCQLPREEWHTIVPEYILTAYENQGVWNAGYLRSDLENGVPNPPMYVSVEEDFITFKKAADDTEAFLKSIFFMAVWCMDSAWSFSDKDEAIRALQSRGMDISLVQKEGVNFYLDTDTNVLYACMVMSSDVVHLLIVEEDAEEDDDE